MPKTFCKPHDPFHRPNGSLTQSFTLFRDEERNGARCIALYDNQGHATGIVMTEAELEDYLDLMREELGGS